MPTSNSANPIKPAKFIAFDSSHLGNLSRERLSTEPSQRKSATALERAIEERGYIPILCMHHFQELLSHNDDHVIAQRIDFLRSLPLVALVNSVNREDIAGSIFDIQATGVLTAFQQPHATPRAIRDDVARQIFRLASGAEAIRPFLKDLPAIRTELAAMAEKHRNIVAISYSDFASVSNNKVADFISGEPPERLNLQQNVASLEATLGNDIRQHGDKRITDPEGVAATFMADIYRRGISLTEHESPSLQILAAFNIDLSEVAPETTIGQIGEWAVFRKKLSRLNAVLQLPWNELKTGVREERIPSGIISLALARFRPRTSEWKGSDLTDSYLACLAPYSDLTLVDKRTYEGLRIARRKNKEVAKLIRRVDKAKSTRAILDQLTSLD